MVTKRRRNRAGDVLPYLMTEGERDGDRERKACEDEMQKQTHFSASPRSGP